MGNDDDNLIIDWIRPAHLDDVEGNPDPNVAEDARAAGVDVEQVLSQEVSTQASGSTGHTGGDHQDKDDDSTDSNDSDGGTGKQPAVAKSGRPSGGQLSQESGRKAYEPWTEEKKFAHSTQDEDHGAPDIGTSRTPSSSRRRRTRRAVDEFSFTNSVHGGEADALSMRFGSLEIGSHSEQGSNSYGVPTSYDPYSDNSKNSFGPPQPMPTIMYQPLPIMLQPQVQHPIRVYDQFPIHGMVVENSQADYTYHVSVYLNNYSDNLTWYQYYVMSDTRAATLDPPRSSFWY